NGVRVRPFALPNFQPSWVKFELNSSTGEISNLERIGLKNKDNTPMSGLPNLSGQAGLAYSDEVGADVFGRRLENDPLGVDLEGITRAADGTYWMVDEYRPSILHFDNTGKLIERYVPQGSNASGIITGVEALPAVYAQRRANRGFEAVAYQNGKVYAFIQSALDNPDVANDRTSRDSLNLRILEFDSQTKQTTAEYLYRLESLQADKIGDAVSLENGKILVVERDDNSGAAAFKKVFQIDLAEATNLMTADLTRLPAGKTIETASLAELTAAGIQLVNKTLYVDLIAAGYDPKNEAKVEGLTLLDTGEIAVVTDNDFGIGGATLDPATGILTPKFPGDIPALGIVLPNEIEANTISGISNVTGSNYADEIVGNNQANQIAGGAGKDSLTGGGATDIFSYQNSDEADDMIIDFSGDDTISISATNFGGGLRAGVALSMQAAATGVFVSGTNPQPLGTSANFLYNTQTGVLSFDSDGTGANSAIVIATLEGAPNLMLNQIAIA
ncbi:MAG TPA: esterase-like activity of phytase family protein, partial [Phormidium sp.]